MDQKYFRLLSQLSTEREEGTDMGDRVMVEDVRVGKGIEG